MKYYLFTFLVSILFSLPSNSQVTLRGVLIDSESNEPIQYANIFYKNHQHIGTLSELDGKFVLKRIENVDGDTIVFSSLGYKVVNIPIAKFGEDLIEVKMDLEAISLQEVSIIDTSYLRKLLINVVENIPNNYPIENHRLTGYFQELSISEGEYSHFLEAYLTVENRDYRKKGKLTVSYDNTQYPYADNKVHFHQMRRTDDRRDLPPRLESWLGGSIHQLLFNNKIYEKSILGWRNYKLEDLAEEISELGQSSSEGIKWNNIYSTGEKYRDGDTLINIIIEDFPMVDEVDSIVTYIGKKSLLINKSDLAIEQIISGFSDAFNTEYADDFFDKTFDEVHYRKVNGRYYPSLFISSIGLKYNLETRHELNTLKFVVQNVQTNNKGYVKIKPRKKLGRESRLVEKKYKYNPEFWSSYSIPKRMEAPLAMKATLSRKTTLQEQFKQNEKKRK